VGILTDPAVSHCPFCGQRFNRRKRPVELGVSNRVTSRMSSLEHAMLERRAHTMHVSTGAPAPRDMPPLIEPERREIDLTPARDVDLAAIEESDATAAAEATGEAAEATAAGTVPPVER
ncbi:MAG TPA: hypothetical protein VFZ83_08545, partial [Acidimicrobiia bacterium]|nr:hypothetical protein [Acidimicrobiia bacterium]